MKEIVQEEGIDMKRMGAVLERQRLHLLDQLETDASDVLTETIIEGWLCFFSHSFRWVWGWWGEGWESCGVQRRGGVVVGAWEEEEDEEDEENTERTNTDFEPW